MISHYGYTNNIVDNCTQNIWEKYNVTNNNKKDIVRHLGSTLKGRR